MGDRAFVIFKDRQEMSPTVYPHWDGSQVPTLLEKLEQLMATRRDDCECACARFIGLCHQLHAESNLSLGVLNTNIKYYFTQDWDGYWTDAGVIIVDCEDFSWQAYQGYLAESNASNEAAQHVWLPRAADRASAPPAWQKLLPRQKREAAFLVTFTRAQFFPVWEVGRSAGALAVAEAGRAAGLP